MGHLERLLPWILTLSTVLPDGSVDGPECINDVAFFFAGEMSVTNGLQDFGYVGKALDQHMLQWAVRLS